MNTVGVASVHWFVPPHLLRRAYGRTKVRGTAAVAMETDSGVCELCGQTLVGDHSGCRRLEAQMHAEANQRDEQLIAEFKLRRVTPENRAGYELAVRAVSKAVEEPVVVNEAHAFEAEGWWFIPYGWIGCAGHIVEKQSGIVKTLGSAFPLSLCFWGQARGALKSPCTLVVDRVRDPVRARELLAKLDNRSPWNPVPVQGRAADGTHRWLEPENVLAAVPFQLQSPSLWFALPALKEAETSRAFDFHIE